MWQKEQIILELQKNGRRITEQRKMLIDVILEGNWVNRKDIYYEAAKRDPTIGLATVYRIINTLEEMGVLVRTNEFTLSQADKEDQLCQQQSYVSY